MVFINKFSVFFLGFFCAIEGQVIEFRKNPKRPHLNLKYTKGRWLGESCKIDKDCQWQLGFTCLETEAFPKKGLKCQCPTGYLLNIRFDGMKGWGLATCVPLLNRPCAKDWDIFANRKVPDEQLMCDPDNHNIHLYQGGDPMLSCSKNKPKTCVCGEKYKYKIWNETLNIELLKFLHTSNKNSWIHLEKGGDEHKRYFFNKYGFACDSKCPKGLVPTSDNKCKNPHQYAQYDHTCKLNVKEKYDTCDPSHLKCINDTCKCPDIHIFNPLTWRCVPMEGVVDELDTICQTGTKAVMGCNGEKDLTCIPMEDYIGLGQCKCSDEGGMKVNTNRHMIRQWPCVEKFKQKCD